MPNNVESRKAVQRSARELIATGSVRIALVAGIAALIVVHGFWPDKFEVDSATVALALLAVVVALLPLLESASFPGGGGLVFRQQLDQLDEAVEQLAQDDAQPVLGSTGAAEQFPEAGQRSAAERVVRDVLVEATKSPRLAVMLLSSELDRAIHRLLMGSGWGVARRRWTARQGVTRLVELGVIPASAEAAVELFTQVRNAVIHGASSPTDEEILRALDSGIEIYTAVANVPRERNFVLATDITLYSDEDATARIEDAMGVILRTISAGFQQTEIERIFPTTRKHFRVGEEVAWVWSHSASWGPAWYRDSRSDAIRKAWDGAAEFIGPPIDSTSFADLEVGR